MLVDEYVIRINKRKLQCNAKSYGCMIHLCTEFKQSFERSSVSEN